MFDLKEDLELEKAEQELYYWYTGSKSNFTGILYTLIAKADSINKEKLRKSYPKEVQVMSDFQNLPNYWDEVQERIQNKK